MLDKFNNYSNEQLADEIGKADLIVKQADEGLTILKDVFKARNCTAARGTLFVVTVSTSTSKRLNTDKLREVLGDAVKDYETETTSTRLTIKPSPKIAELGNEAA